VIASVTRFLPEDLDGRIPWRSKLFSNTVLRSERGKRLGVEVGGGRRNAKVQNPNDKKSNNEK
jgi:hypothetical protein